MYVSSWVAAVHGSGLGLGSYLKNNPFIFHLLPPWDKCFSLANGTTGCEMCKAFSGYEFTELKDAYQPLIPNIDFFWLI